MNTVPRKPLRQMWSFVAALIVILLVVGIWTLMAVRESVIDIYTGKLQVILNADIAALTNWIDNEKDDVEILAKQPGLNEEIVRLEQKSQAESDVRQTLLDSDELKAVRDLLMPLYEEEDYQGFYIINRFGRCIAAVSDSMVGSEIEPEQMVFFTNVLRGKTLGSKPVIISTEDDSLDDLPVIMFATPIYNDSGIAIAALALASDPEKDFTRILSIARTGNTGETYAFDKDGVMLSGSRFLDQLKEIGLIEDSAKSILNLKIRDPGGNLLKGYKSQLPIAARPLTKMAAAAVIGQSGIDLEGYRGYRGVKVIGAWTWLDDHEFGIATEVDSYEAYKVLRPLKIAFACLILVLVLAAGIITVFVYKVENLKERIKTVQQLGQYTLEEKIGEGGFGVVYKARHAMLQRPTALKMLKKEVLSPDAIARFEREVQLTSQLTHPNTIEIYDYGRTSKGIFYYVMEYLKGITLTQLLAIEPYVPPERVLCIVKQICGSLEEAHGIGLIHRDIKPQNIIICQRGLQSDVVKVLDFGLARDINVSSDVQVTVANVVAGTPIYIAPERLKDSKNFNARSDIYSLGGVMFNLLTGQDVFHGISTVDICNQVINAVPPRASELISHFIPSELDDLVFSCLSKDPANRPESCSEIIETLDSIKNNVWTQKDAKQWWAQNWHKIDSAGLTPSVEPNPDDSDDSTIDRHIQKERI